MPENCIYCHNRCDLRSPKCRRGEQMAQEVAAGTWKAPADGDSAETRHREGRHHGHHGGHH